MDRYDDKVRKAEAEYKEAHPEAENPFSWGEQFYIEDIYDFVVKAKGRIVLVEESEEVTDGGKLIYG